MKKKEWMAAGILVLGLSLLGWAVAARSARPLAPQNGFSAHDAYQNQCASCHGMHGGAHTVKGRKDHVRPVSQTIKKMTVAQMVEVVKNGKGEYMNGYSSRFSDAQIHALVEYYRSLAK